MSNEPTTLDDQIVSFVRRARRRVLVAEVACQFEIPHQEADDRMNALWDAGKLDKEDE